jgi:acyl carrier protein phosphodiesterase
MNYLAHAYLSFDQPEILVGNMISDFVKGKTKFDYDQQIQRGIMLHRMIDQFTDVHPATRQAKLFFSPDYRLYSGAFVDVVYDHFLATDSAQWTGPDLKVFSRDVYEKLSRFQSVFPEKFTRLFTYMRAEDWLFNYQYKQNIKNSFAGLVRRARYMHEYHTAYNIFELHYDELQVCYGEFFPEVRQFAMEKISDLLN